MKNLGLKLGALMLCTQLFSTSALAEQSAMKLHEQQHMYEFEHMAHVLNSHPVKDNTDTVGAIMYKKKDGRIFILLGRDNIKLKDVERKGKFCTLGGYAKKDMTYVDSIRYNLSEESMGLENPPKDYIINNSAFMVTEAPTFRKTHSRRKIIYALIPAGEQYYVSAAAFNELRNHQIASLMPKEQTKDMFVWVDVEDLMLATSKVDGLKKHTKKNLKKKIEVDVHDIDGQIHHLELAHFFVNDFVKHTDLSAVIAKLKTLN